MALADTVAPAMGTMARLYLVGGPTGLEARLRVQLDELERRWSRFIEDSEICQLNAALGQPVKVSPATLLLVKRAVQASRATAGAFDPLVLHDMERIGYSESFDLLPSPNLPLVAMRDHRAPGRVLVRTWAGPAAAIRIDASASTVALPTGTGFDPGGIGKGLAADLLVEAALKGGATSALVDIGGDICVGGTAPSGGWQIALANPFAPADVVGYVALPWGAIATSSTSARRWQQDAATHHHIVDPSTGTSAESGTVAATVVAGQGWRADALANAAVVMHPKAALEMLSANGVEAMLVHDTGQLVFTAAMAQATSESAA